MATPPDIASRLSGAFALLDDTTGAPIAASIGPQEIGAFQRLFEHAVAALNPTTMPKPNMCSRGREKTGRLLWRFYWFGILTIEGKSYGLGANLHSDYNLGSMWLMASDPIIKNNFTPEIHPKRDPKIPNQPAWKARLIGLTKTEKFK